MIRSRAEASLALALEPAPGCLGALAVEGRPRSVATMRWSRGAESDRPRG